MFVITNWEKNQSTWHLYKQWLHNCYKFYEDEIETHNRQKTENAERKTLIFQKKGHLPKPVLKKIMTTGKECVKDNFIAPLTWS